MMTALLPEPAPATALGTRRQRAPIVLVFAAAAAIGVGIASGSVLGLRERTRARPTTELRARPPSPIAPPALTLPPSSPAPSAVALAPTARYARALVPPASAASKTGRLLTAPSEAGHRVFVDGRFAGSGGAALVVRCGTHEVRVGSAGRLRRVDVPCDGAVEVAR